jgi:hypothetical protein
MRKKVSNIMLQTNKNFPTFDHHRSLNTFEPRGAGISATHSAPPQNYVMPAVPTQEPPKINCEKIVYVSPEKMKKMLRLLRLNSQDEEQ